MAFTNDTRSSSTLTADSRSANATFTVDTMNLIRPTWGSEVLTWMAELHTWAQMISAFNADVRN